jgi:glutamate synthase (NADPH/NADH) small chain
MGDTAEALELECGRIAVDDNRKTSLPDVWAGGDCVNGGEDLTVYAVQDGKMAAIDIDRFLRRQSGLNNGLINGSGE